MGNGRGIVYLGCILGLAGSIAGCGQGEEKAAKDATVCAPEHLTPVASSTGKAKVFLIDPISASGNNNLFPTSIDLDQFTTSVSLLNLNGLGVLSGKYVDVINRNQCGVNYGAYEKENQFIYNQKDWKFQEAMAYYFGDLYRSGLDSIGYLMPKSSVIIVAHCKNQDNAYFQRSKSGGTVTEFVCLGDSVSTPGASYADDGIVMVHELQHATTVDYYSDSESLNQLFYDESGSLNEAISDFMGLIFSDILVSPVFNLDPKIFSRWALGTFDPGASHIRGAHKCPVYDSHYPNCDRFPAFEAPSAGNGETTTISYVYPDGMGWPFPNNYSGANPASLVFSKYGSQEEIHNAGVLMSGALWDVYTAILKNHGNDKALANRVSTIMVLEAVKHLPMPNHSTQHAPVTYISFASALLEAAKSIRDLTPTDLSSITQVLKDRGLYQYPEIKVSNWMSAGAGVNTQIPNSTTPGVYILDDPHRLQTWLSDMDANPGIVTQGIETGLNNRLDPGEVVAIWFDIQNNSSITAGGVLVTVTSNDPDLVVLDDTVNIGYLSTSGLNQTQVMYGKINGTDIVASLNPGNSGIPLANSYFNTNALFYKTYRNAVWIKGSANLPHGKVVSLEVKATPSNGISSTQNFQLTIN